MKRCLVCLSLLATAAVLLSAACGTTWLTAAEWRAALGGSDPLLRAVLWEIRLPRAVLGLVAGISLGLTGAALQGFTRNPLADSGLLGISGGASLGAVLALYTGFSLRFPLALPSLALLGAAAATGLIVAIAGRRAGIQTLILAGVAMGALASALTSLVLNLSPNPYAATEIVFWLMGSLQDRSWQQVVIILPFVVPGWLLLFSAARGLQALTLGEEAAASMGIPMESLRRRIILGTALAVGPVTAVCGGIAFVGLLVPHILRPWVKADPGRLLPVSALGGAVLLITADIATRLIPTSSSTEIKLGVLTALIGAPFFFHLIFKLRRSYP